MRLADVRKAYIILRKGKWDIPSYLGDGKFLDMRIAYLMMDLPYGPPYTLDQGLPFVKDAFVAFGFPDILFHSDKGFEKCCPIEWTAVRTSSWDSSRRNSRESGHDRPRGHVPRARNCHPAT